MNIKESDALIVVDVQNDFCPGGALAVKDGHAVIDVINRLIPRFQYVVFTRDWHPANHCSFNDSPTFADGSWPAHCVADTAGAAFHPLLHAPPSVRIVSKGVTPESEAYSGFEGFLDDGSSLDAMLKSWGVSRTFVCGLATDYCVKATALDSVRCGYKTIVIEDACRGVDNPEGSAAEAIATMRRAGVKICRAEELA